MTTTGRRLQMGLGSGAAEKPDTPERFDGFTPEQWQVVKNAYAAGDEAGYARGHREGYDEAYARTLGEWVATLSTEPRTPFIQTGERKPIHITDRKSQTAQQILAQARWSWRQIENAIQPRELRETG